MYLFLDCEFNGWHDQGTGELISLGLVSGDGKYEFYEVVGCKNPSPFVEQHVLPILGQSAIPMWELVNKLCRANSNMRCDSLKSLMIINKLSKFL